MRIVSLLPSATEIVYALGMDAELVGVTHECDYPPEARSKPHVTRNLLPPGLPSALIDQAVRESRRDVHTIYALDSEQLVTLSPDVVLTQTLCEVCAVSRSAVDSAVCSMPRQATVLSLDPHTLDEMLESVLDAGQALGAPARATEFVAGLRHRIDRVRASVSRVAARPRVFCCEWLDPVYRSGHWVPEQVRLAAGDDGLGLEREPSRRVAWDGVLDYAPEVVVLMPCGYGAHAAAERIDELANRPGWAGLPAVRQGRVFAVDGSAYFSRPGPRLVDGLELLARILHPETFSTLGPAGAALRLVTRPDGDARFEPYR
ncbi:MAG: cobalamin-binding protein [Dehalococcoidia bacterium]|nr:cobalamin-binding protein [Dehalococcoidia bacterium]